MNTQWDNLMDECIDIREDRDAKSFFKAVESLAKILGLTCDTGKEFDDSEYDDPGLGFHRDGRENQRKPVVRIEQGVADKQSVDGS